MHIRDPQNTPKRINPVTEFTQQLGRVEEEALYVQKFKGMLEGVLQQQGMVFLNREAGRVSH